MFGFDQSRFLPPPADHFEVDKLAYVSIDMMDVRLLSDVRTRIWGKTQPVHARRLYTRRTGGARRRELHNQREVETVLRDFEFEFVEADKLDFAQQVNIFSDASVIIGLHGAGLSNMMYAKPGALVIEISDLIDYPNPYYYALACALGHRYAHLKCRTVFDETRPLFYRDVNVDTENMRRQLDAYLAAGTSRIS
jgi:capsular polysaccharide biosynthesis protein